MQKQKQAEDKSADLTVNPAPDQDALDKAAAAKQLLAKLEVKAVRIENVGYWCCGTFHKTGERTHYSDGSSRITKGHE